MAMPKLKTASAPPQIDRQKAPFHPSMPLLPKYFTFLIEVMMFLNPYSIQPCCLLIVRTYFEHIS